MKSKIEAQQERAREDNLRRANAYHLLGVEVDPLYLTINPDMAEAQKTLDQNQWNKEWLHDEWPDFAERVYQHLRGGNFSQDQIRTFMENLEREAYLGIGSDSREFPREPSAYASDWVAWLDHAHPKMSAHIYKANASDMELFARKQYNYGSENIKAGEDITTPDGKRFALTALWIRMNDKMQRIKQLALKGREDQVGEAIEDTLQDLRNYAHIFQMVENGVWGS